MALSAIVHKRIIPITKNIPTIPFRRMGRLDKKAGKLIIITPHPTRLSSTPAAITEAICPETLTPIVCMSKKF